MIVPIQVGFWRPAIFVDVEPTKTPTILDLKKTIDTIIPYPYWIQRIYYNGRKWLDHESVALLLLESYGTIYVINGMHDTA